MSTFLGRAVAQNLQTRPIRPQSALAAVFQRISQPLMHSVHRSRMRVMDFNCPRWSPLFWPLRNLRFNRHFDFRLRARGLRL